MDERAAQHHVATQLRHQSGAPEPIYQPLLRALADDVEAGGPAWRPLAPVAHLPADDAVPLRLMGAAHRLALTGTAPAYAAHLPTCGGDGDAEAAWPALRDLCGSGALDDGVRQPVQTNEPARTAALLPGFVEVTAATGLPLRLLEVGASAGLLLRFDAYRHEIGPATWGPPGSPVLVRAEGSAPLGPVEVASRRGCDPNPLDVVRDATLLLSFVWPSQLERFRRLEVALALAASLPVEIDRAGAGAWLGERLVEPAAGVATVVFHSIVWQYLSADERAVAQATIEGAGLRATADAPLAWLRLEPHPEPATGAELRLTTWPWGVERVLALCGYHGGPIRWHDRAVRIPSP